MNTVPAFLSVDQALAVHQRMVDEFGGDASLRDRRLLESAIAMPAASFGGDFLHDGLPAMAAAYLYHLCKGHPFVDGNKRTALATAELFLILNRMRLNATNDQLYELILATAEGRLSKEDAVIFFRNHSEPERG